jgi:hypothetical protein
MKKKFICLLILLLIIVGCGKEEKKENVEEKTTPTPTSTPEPTITQEPTPQYIDLNNTPIAIYRNNKKVVEFKDSFRISKDMALFRIYPSTEEYISFSGQSFHNKFNEYNTSGNLKIGFNLKYDIEDGRHVSQNVLHVSDAYAYEGYILEFLYDDYDLNKNNKIYSHVEIDQEKDDTIFSSIKLYPQAAYPEITSKILLTVFTYDSEDDFDENNEYRGNSKYTITICDINKTC